MDLFLLLIEEIISSFILVICVMVGVAFFTLLERKVLGYMQIRKGPNKVGVIGIIQPFADALKLFSKEQMMLEVSNFFIYYFCPIFGLLLSMLVWLVYPVEGLIVDFEYGILFFLVISGFNVYAIMGSGWASNSKYALLGSYRSVAQTISYEVSMALVFLILVMIIGSYNLFMFKMFQESGIWFIYGMLPVAMVWVGICLAECNRAPFDFAEGESELVSGFNVEYSGGGFAMIFLAEYGSILAMSMLSIILFFGSGMYMSFKTFLFSILYLWVRGSFPRYRYDKLMGLAWKIYLPLCLNYMIMIVGIVMIWVEWF